VRLALDAAMKADGSLASEADRKAIAEAAARLDKIRTGEDRDLIVAAIEALEKAALPFAQARIDRAIGRALSGRSLDEVEASVASGAAEPPAAAETN
jgi:molecular chaperone HscA